MPGLKLNHVGKKGPGDQLNIQVQTWLKVIMDGLYVQPNEFYITCHFSGISSSHGSRIVLYLMLCMRLQKQW